MTVCGSGNAKKKKIYKKKDNFVSITNTMSASLVYRQVYNATSVYNPSVSSTPCSLSYHEAAGDIGLEDFIKGALGERAAVEGEDLRHVAQTVFIMSAALYCQGGLGVVGAGFVLRCTRRIEYTVQL